MSPTDCDWCYGTGEDASGWNSCSECDGTGQATELARPGLVERCLMGAFFGVARALVWVLS